MDTVAREHGHRCKYCTQRKPRRLFLVLKPREAERLLGFVVCDTCVDQWKAEVAEARPKGDSQ
jgi:hypothetical protein